MGIPDALEGIMGIALLDAQRFDFRARRNLSAGQMKDR
jgi:hypothetical protein